MSRFFALILISEFFLFPVPYNPFPVPYAYAEDLTSANFIIRNPAVDNSGGGWSTSDNFQSFNILGQPAIDRSTSASFESQSGFGYVRDPVFTMTAPSNISYSALPVSTATQNSTATMSNVDVVNTRGTGAGWTITINATNMTRRGASTKMVGDNDTVSFTGTYTGVTAPHTYGTYKIEITTGGAVGTAVFKWIDPAGTETTGVATAASIVLNNGITVNFGTATYVVGDKWILRVDSIGYTNLTLTPGSVTINFGDPDVTSGAAGAFSGAGITSNSRTLMSATSGNGEGSYTQTPVMNQSVHANTMSGTFEGTITLTVS